jgi:hypothetical protein
MSFDPSWSDVFDDLDPLFTSPHRPTDAEIAEIVDRFVVGDLSNAEAEAALERLGRAKKRVLPVVVDLCRSTDPNAYRTGVILLKEINLTQAKVPLRELLEDPMLDDEHKMSLLSALEALGGIAPGENPLIYLRDPESAFRKSHEAFLNSLQDPFHLSALMEEDLESGENRLFQPQVLESMASTQDRRLVPLLLCLVHVPDDRVVLAAVDALRAVGDASVLPVLEERAAWDASPKVRRAARHAAAALLEEPPDALPSIFHLPVAPPPVVRCLISTVDGNGGQMCLVIRQMPDGERGCVDVMFNDHEGIKDCVAGRGETVEELEVALVEGMEEIGVAVVDISLPRLRADLERAYQTTLKMRRRLPPAYLIWRDWLYGGDGLSLDHYAIPIVSPDEMGDLLQRCAELLDLEEFSSWVFDAYELRGFERKYRKLLRRGGADDALESLVGQALEQMEHLEWYDRLRDRLERQAWLLAQVYEEEAIPKMALAAAAALSGNASARASEHPLLREMMRRSLLGLAAVA